MEPQSEFVVLPEWVELLVAAELAIALLGRQPETEIQPLLVLAPEWVELVTELKHLYFFQLFVYQSQLY